MSSTLTIDSRYCGPPGTGNGGYVSGRLAAFLRGDAEVTLRRPVPLDRALRVEHGDRTVSLHDGDVLLAEALPVTLDLEPPAPVGLGDAEAASRRFPRFVEHPLPRCFVCGPEREEGEGLRIFPGPVPGRDTVAAPWTPHDSLAGKDGRIAPELLWAALDCTGAFAVNEPPRGLVLLGRLAVRILETVHAGETVIVLGWPIADHGRKLIAGTALYTATGRPLAVARAVWVFVRVSGQRK